MARRSKHFYKRFVSPETASIKLNAGTGKNWYSCKHPGCAPGGYTYDDRGTGIPMHRACDISGEPGKTPVLAGRKGTVTRTINIHGSAFGLQVEIKHRRWWGRPYRGKSLYSFHAHLDRILVEPGEKVQARTPVGIMGSTGNSSGEHDHKELRTSQNWADTIDEFDWLEDARLRELKRR